VPASNGEKYVAVFTAPDNCLDFCDVLKIDFDKNVQQISCRTLFEQLREMKEIDGVYFNYCQKKKNTIQRGNLIFKFEKGLESQEIFLILFWMILKMMII
jgi:hypothetical protein